MTRFRIVLFCSLRSCAERVGRVERLGMGSSRAAEIIRISLSRASLRFCSWVRKRRAWMEILPWRSIRDPAICRSLSRAAGSRKEETSGSYVSRMAVATLLIFCPPGPEAWTASNVNSESGISGGNRRDPLEFATVWVSCSGMQIFLQFEDDLAGGDPPAGDNILQIIKCPRVEFRHIGSDQAVDRARVRPRRAQM